MSITKRLYSIDAALLISSVLKLQMILYDTT